MALVETNLMGEKIDKVQIAIQRLKTFEPEDGYYLAFSGGKDSQCIYHLAKMAGVKFDAHYCVTSVDPPELVRFIKEHYPDVSREIPHDKDGKPITMWSLIVQSNMPPTRMVLLQGTERIQRRWARHGDGRAMGGKRQTQVDARGC